MGAIQPLEELSSGLGRPGHNFSRSTSYSMMLTILQERPRPVVGFRAILLHFTDISLHEQCELR